MRTSLGVKSRLTSFSVRFIADAPTEPKNKQLFNILIKCNQL